MIRRRVYKDVKPRKIRTLFYTVFGLAVVSAMAGNMTWVTFYLLHKHMPYVEALALGTLLALVDFVTTYVNKRRVLFFKRETVDDCSGTRVQST